MRMTFAALVALCSCVVASAAETKALKVETWDVRGPATYTVNGGTPRPLTTGVAIPQGAVIKTGVGAAVDLSLGRRIGIIRLAQNTVVNLDKLQVTDNKETVPNIQVSVPEGTLLGDLRKLADAAKFEVKLPTGLAGIRGGKFRIQPQAYIVVLSGEVLFVHVPSSGEPVLHKLNGPPPAYFSPDHGVRAAPPALAQEVQRQIEARLRAP